jgi:hypothetical protein
MKSFIMGAVAGGIAMYLWRDQIERYLDTGTRDIRTRAADKLKKAGELMETASGKIGETIEAGQEAIRPPVTGVRTGSANR